jgi:hypothetical protein
VFIEDALSVSGDALAFVALGLNQITGSPVPQGVAAVLIGELQEEQVPPTTVMGLLWPLHAPTAVTAPITAWLLWG